MNSTETDLKEKFSDRQEPQALELEESVLGISLIETGAFEEVFTILDHPDYFYNEKHRKIYQAMHRLFQDGKRIDHFTVVQALKKAKEYEIANDPAYLAKITSGSTAINLQEHCLIIKQQAAKRKAIEAGYQLINQGFDDSVDIDDLLTLAQDNIDRIEGSFQGASLFRDFSYYLNKSAEAMHNRIQLHREGKAVGISTPIQSLTKMLTGWLPGNLIVIAGRPSMGKTALALSSMLVAAQQGVHVNLFSLEMPGVRLTDRILCGMASVNHSLYREGAISESDAQKIEETVFRLQKLPINIDDNTLPTMDYIRSRARVNKRKGKCGMIIIDYLQLLNIPKSKYQNRERDVADLSWKAKSLSMDLDVPILLLSQLNRQCETRCDKRPVLADLRESGSIEQDADVVLLLHRPEIYGILEEDQQSTVGRGEIIVAKHRDGKQGTIYFGHNDSLTRIHDYEIKE